MFFYCMVLHYLILFYLDFFNIIKYNITGEHFVARNENDAGHVHHWYVRFISTRTYACKGTCTDRHTLTSICVMEDHAIRIFTVCLVVILFHFLFSFSSLNYLSSVLLFSLSSLFLFFLFLPSLLCVLSFF